MFASTGKKEIWIGIENEWGAEEDPRLEISWGHDGKNRVLITFEEFVAEELGAHERGGPHSGGEYDEQVLNIFQSMRKTLKRAQKQVRRRNAL